MCSRRRACRAPAARQDLVSTMRTAWSCNSRELPRRASASLNSPLERVVPWPDLLQGAQRRPDHPCLRIAPEWRKRSSASRGLGPGSRTAWPLLPAAQWYRPLPDVNAAAVTELRSLDPAGRWAAVRGRFCVRPGDQPSAEERDPHGDQVPLAAGGDWGFAPEPRRTTGTPTCSTWAMS